MVECFYHLKGIKNVALLVFQALRKINVALNKKRANERRGVTLSTTIPSALSLIVFIYHHFKLPVPIKEIDMRVSFFLQLSFCPGIELF